MYIANITCQPAAISKRGGLSCELPLYIASATCTMKDAMLIKVESSKFRSETLQQQQDRRSTTGI